MTKAYCLLASASLLCNGPVAGRLMAALTAAPPSAARNAAPDRPRRQAGQPAAFTVRTARDGDGLFRLEGTADGRRISFIVDTGATTTVLSPRDAALLGLSADGDAGTETLRTAGGATPMVWRRLARLSIAGSRLRNLDVVVVRDGPDHSLLGQDVLAQLGAITLTGDRLEIRPARR